MFFFLYSEDEILQLQQSQVAEKKRNGEAMELQNRAVCVHWNFDVFSAVVFIVAKQSTQLVRPAFEIHSALNQNAEASGT